MAAENQFFEDNLRTNWDIFKILMANIWSSIVEISKKYRFVKSTSSLVEKNSKLPSKTGFFVQNWMGNLLVR